MSEAPINAIVDEAGKLANEPFGRPEQIVRHFFSEGALQSLWAHELINPFCTAALAAPVIAHTAVDGTPLQITLTANDVMGAHAGAFERGVAAGMAWALRHRKT